MQSYATFLSGVDGSMVGRKWMDREIKRGTEHVKQKKNNNNETPFQSTKNEQWVGICAKKGGAQKSFQR